MKDFSFKVQCYILVPVIFAGFTALAALLTYHLMRAPPALFAGQRWPLAASGAILIGTAFLTGILIIWLLLNPVERFVDHAQRMMPTTDPLPPKVTPTRYRYDQTMTPISQTLNRVTEALDNVEARALFPEIVAPSPAMRAILGLVVKIAPTDSTALLQGESGTGKELVARAIHARSRRAAGAFVAINCAGIPDGLLESELFGYEKGAFTGAVGRKIGKFEAASGGTLFLDEIGDMPMVTQSKILRALQEREIERVGGGAPIPIDIRVIAATHRDLPRLVAENRFREDLYFRINVFSVFLPPLRDRREDIPLLTMHLLRQIKPDATIAPNALAALIAHPWPGNVRELRNMIEAAAALSNGVIQSHHLCARVTNGTGATILGDMARPKMNPPRGLDQRLQDLERGMILEALTRTGGVQVQAAEQLGIKERSLWHRIAKYHIDVEAIRQQRTRMDFPPATTCEARPSIL